jgi:hypothetical protein
VGAEELRRARVLFVGELGEVQKSVEGLTVPGGDGGNVDLWRVELVVEKVLIEADRVDDVAPGCGCVRRDRSVWNRTK